MELMSIGYMAGLLQRSPAEIEQALEATNGRPYWTLNNVRYFGRLEFHEAKVWLAEHAEADIRVRKP